MTWMVVLTCLAQAVILYRVSAWGEALAAALAVTALAGVLTWTRRRWDAHLDMLLLMAGPGGLGMMASMLVPGPSCHVEFRWETYGVMTLGMLVLSVPVSWTQARCVVAARAEGYGALAMVLDLVGMQIGMTLGHVPGTLLKMGDPRLAWVHHGSMVAGMLLGMSAGMLLLPWLRRQEWTRRVGLVH